jgi:RNA polymerase sigma-70 factor (ECF subfamily)
MAEPQDISELIRRIRVGDKEAAVQLLERYGKVFRRTIRLRLENDAELRRLIDTEDIRQSVFGSLCVRLRLGQFHIDNDRDLVNLLFRMAHNKVTAKQRRQHGGQRDSLPEVVAPGPPPGEEVIIKDLLEKALGKLSEEEGRILELRDQGASWETVAAELGGSAEARRKQWERARERIAQDLGLAWEE